MNIKVNLHPWFSKIFVFDLVTSWPQVTWRDLYTREAFLFAFYYWKSNFCMPPLHGKIFGDRLFYKYFFDFFFFSWRFYFNFSLGRTTWPWWWALSWCRAAKLKEAYWTSWEVNYNRIQQFRTTTGFNSLGQLVTSKVTSMARIWRKSLNVCAHLAEGRLRLFCM